MRDRCFRHVAGDMKHSSPWDRKLWGIVFLATRPRDRPILIGGAWHVSGQVKSYQGEPTRALVFQTRSDARDWVKTRAGWGAERYRVVRVREIVRKMT